MGSCRSGYLRTLFPVPCGSPIIVPPMAKRSDTRTAPPMLFVGTTARRHSHLFVPKLLKEAANRPAIDGTDFDKAKAALKQWADLADAEHLNQKETSLDAEFLEKVF